MPVTRSSRTPAAEPTARPSTLCGGRSPSGDKLDTLLTTRGASAEWRLLADALTLAFKGSREVSPNHPAAEVMCQFNARRLARELAGLGRWNDGCYTRTTLLEGEGFVVLLLCWSPGVMSPVHAHSDATTRVQSSCFMRVLEGELSETLYDNSAILGEDKVLAAAGAERTLEAGDYTYIDDNKGLHKVGNASGTTGAMSLHIYAPGWSTVQLYDEEVVQPPTDAGGAPLLNLDAWGDF